MYYAVRYTLNGSYDYAGHACQIVVFNGRKARDLYVRANPGESVARTMLSGTREVVGARERVRDRAGHRWVPASQAMPGV